MQVTFHRRIPPKHNRPPNLLCCCAAVPHLCYCCCRWLNQLNPNVKKGPFSAEEDAAIMAAHNIFGNKWASIAKLLPGRCVRSENCRKRQGLQGSKKQQMARQRSHAKEAAAEPAAAFRSAATASMRIQHLHLQDKQQGFRQLTAAAAVSSSYSCRTC